MIEFVDLATFAMQNKYLKLSESHYTFDELIEAVQDECINQNSSLFRCKLDYIDIYLLHLLDYARKGGHVK